MLLVGFDIIEIFLSGKCFLIKEKIIENFIRVLEFFVFNYIRMCRRFEFEFVLVEFVNDILLYLKLGD